MAAGSWPNYIDILTPVNNPALVCSYSFHVMFHVVFTLMVSTLVSILGLDFTAGADGLAADLGWCFDSNFCLRRASVKSTSTIARLEGLSLTNNLLPSFLIASMPAT